MANPGVSGSQIPAGEDFAQRQIKDLQRDLRELGPSIAKSFAPVIADLAAKQVTLTAAVADIAANVASINDLLTQVVKPQSIYLQATNYALTTSFVTLASATITVPAGFTKAKVTLIGQVGCYNPHTTGGSNSAGGDYVYCKATAGSAWGAFLGTTLLGSNDFSYDVSPVSTVLTGLTGGGTFTVGVSGKIEFANMAADAGNMATVSGDILWFK